MSTTAFPGLNADSPDVDEEPFWTSAVPEEHEEDATDTEALYAVLNLPKDCSEEDIQKSYKRLAGELGFSTRLPRRYRLTPTLQPCYIPTATRTLH